MIPAIFNHVSHQFPHQKPAGIGWMQKDGDDNLAIAMVFNTTKQMYTDFKKPFFWSS
jgi:hypothetical protein